MDILKQKILLEDLKFMRPGNGIHCSQVEKIIGKRVKRNLKENHKINFLDLEK